MKENFLFNNKKENTLKKKKRVIFLLFSIIFILIYLNIRALNSYWLGFESFPSKNSTYFAKTIIIILSEFLCFLIAIEIILRYVKKNQFLIDKVSFIGEINEKDWSSLFFLFPIIILVEEVIFRGVLFEILNINFSILCSILINATLFSLYHIHIYFSSKNLKLSIIYMVLSFFLVIFLSDILPYIGILGVWIIHLLMILYFYLRIYYKNENITKE